MNNKTTLLRPQGTLLAATLILAATFANAETLQRTSDIHIRDPFILVEDGRYFMYASNVGLGGRGVSVRESTDLENWTTPKSVCELPAHIDLKAVWAPEVHRFGGAYWLFTTLTQSTNVCTVAAMGEGVQAKNLTPRGTWAFKATSPRGPFVAVREAPVTPRPLMTLDGTLYVEDGQPYFVYCHEWCQMGNGTIEYAPLTYDFSALAAAPRTLLDARSCMPGADRVTDGPFFWRSEKSGVLYMIWSNFIRGNGYCVLIRRSVSGKIAGPWTKDRLLYRKDGGHGMLFKDLAGKLRLALHQPNSGNRERLHLFTLEDNGDWLRLVP